MAFIFDNPNPSNALVGDCVIRAISIALNKSWDEVYIDLSTNGFLLRDMPSSNRVWGDYLKTQGYKSYMLPDTCPYCYTVKDFCNDFPDGTYILCTGTHVIAVISGNYIDTWDSGNETPVYYWKKEV